MRTRGSIASRHGGRVGSVISSTAPQREEPNTDQSQASKPSREDQTLDLPGRPRVIPTPGHTAGHHSVALEQRGVLFSGDAMASFDYVAGTRGVAQHRFNDDREIALVSLARLDPIDANVVLFGHGDPWTAGLPRALEIARGTAKE